MSLEEIREMIRSEIREAIRQERELTVRETLQRFGLDMKSNDDWISQNKADQIIGRAARTAGKANGTIRYKHIKPCRWGRVMLTGTT